MKYDFLVAGFPKCGTTTIHNLLTQNPQIYLPQCKETFFFSDEKIYVKGGLYLQEHFYGDVTQDQKIGGVEPSFSKYAERMNPYLNASTKVIFVLRNPIDYLFSFYKMCMSFGVREWYEAYKKYGNFSGIVKANIRIGNDKFSLRMRGSLITEAIENGRYIEYIKQYEKIVGKDHIKIILFEEFIKNEIEVVNALFDFIGVKRQKVKVNVGENRSESIMPNSNFGARLLDRREYLHHTYMEHRKDISKTGMKLCAAYYQYVPKIAAKCIDEKVDENIKDRLYGYYYESIKELQEFMNIDLMKAWGFEK